MRLKTKFQDEDFKLGETVDAYVNYGAGDGIKLTAKGSKGGINTFYHDSIKDFTDHWEDAPEEPKNEIYWFIDAYGNIVQNKITKHYGDEYTDMSDDYERQKQIGNRFESEKEAIKARDKLLAWQRIKEAGFEFGGWTHTPITKSLTGYNLHIKAYSDKLADYMDDLQLLFGGEE